jgi:TetR/AcrR family transcriptional regulator, regulator of autoinduction and epiphytic fitness
MIRAERQLSPEKAKAILEGGMQEFLSYGYAATSMDRVAIAAGVSKATVYSHFRDKESLFIALIQQLAAVKFRSIFDSSNPEVLQLPPDVILRELANQMLDVATSEPQFLNFMRVILGESGRFPELARAFVHNVEQTAFHLVCSYFISCPSLKIADPEATARVFVGSLVHFIVVQDMLHGKEIVPMSRDRLIDTLIHLIVGKESL